MVFMNISLFTTFFFLIINPCFAFKTLLINDRNIYEMYEPQDEIPLDVLSEGQLMYYISYLNPKLHEGISLEAMQIDGSRFNSYEEFIQDMFQCDFKSYQFSGEIPRFYLQVRKLQDNQIIGVCAVLQQSAHHYYVDHLGLHKDYRRQKIGSNLINELVKAIPNMQELTLDTRVFNKPAQFFYEKLEFQKMTAHPNPAKQSIYVHYVKMISIE